MSLYADTVNEVLDRYTLTSKQRAKVFKQVADSPCPWSKSIAYMRAHHVAAEAERET